MSDTKKPTRRGQPPPHIHADGRHVHFLSPEERNLLKLAICRYLAWDEGGRKSEEWPSGVGYGIAYDRPRVRSRPTSYGPGKAANPAEDTTDETWLARIDDAWRDLNDYQRTIVRGYVAERRTYAAIIEQLGGDLNLSEEILKAEWAKISVRLYYRIFG